MDITVVESRKLRIVYMGTPEFAAYILDRLVADRYDVCGVVTVPDRLVGRGRQLTPSAVKMSVERINCQRRLEGGLVPILLMQPEKLRDEFFLEQLSSIGADLFIVVAFRMLPRVVWGMPSFGTFNLHASLLPFYRGAAPINWAIINGESVTGVTTFMLNDCIDCGAILDRVELVISSEDDAGSLHDKLMVLGADLVVSTIDKISGGCIDLTAQQLSEGCHYPLAPKIFRSDCGLDFGDCVENLHNRVRGLSPYPAAWAQIVGAQLPDGRIKESVGVKIFASHYSICNSVVSVGGWVTDGFSYLAVRGFDGFLYVDSLQPQNRNRMSVVDFLRGWRDLLLV